MPGTIPNPTPVYRLIHIDNLAVCLQRSGLNAPNNPPQDGLDYRTIHREEVQLKRRITAINCGPRGTVHDYVPFYFGYLSPMLLQLKTGQVVGYGEGQEPLIYLVSSCQAVQAAGAGFAFSDGHGLAGFTEWFDDLAHLDKVDWDMVYQRYWADSPEDMDRQRRKQAEFLVHRFCPWSLIQEIGVLGQATAARVEAILGGHAPACADRSWYGPSGTTMREAAMIQERRGNLLEADAEALVNTVNTVGFMGKGIALQFKQAFPENFKAYEQAVKRGEIQPGRMFVFRTNLLTNPKYIVNFPTKRHWRGKSRLVDIDSGLEALLDEIKRLGIRSIAVPPLGCGNGGLDWRVVRPRIVDALSGVPDLDVLLFEPVGAPEAASMPVRTKKPAMTVARALLVKLMEQYLSLAYRLTLLEVQKLAYLLQEAGEPLKLRYEAGHFGPYADNLNKVLERIEGHLIRGYGDSQKPDAEIQLVPGAAGDAAAFLAAHESSKDRLSKVAELIEGFETPYGMELLSSVHWVARHDPTLRSAQAAVGAVHAWNERKRRMFRESHIHVAWKRLEQMGWLSSAGRSGPEVTA